MNPFFLFSEWCDFNADAWCVRIKLANNSYLDVSLFVFLEKLPRFFFFLRFIGINLHLLHSTVSCCWCLLKCLCLVAQTLHFTYIITPVSQYICVHTCKRFSAECVCCTFNTASHFISWFDYEASDSKKIKNTHTTHFFLLKSCIHFDRFLRFLPAPSFSYCYNHDSLL